MMSWPQWNSLNVAMAGKHYTEEQIAFALRQAESGAPVVEIVRKMGISYRLSYH